MTVACYYTTGNTIRNTTQYDTITMSDSGGGFSCMQNVNNSGNPQLRSHSKDSNGTTVFGPEVNIVTGKSYWINLNFSSAALTTIVAVYDPANSFALVGSSVVNSRADSVIILRMGRNDNHANVAAETTQSWFGNVLIDYTNAAFPLIPSAGTDTTPPSAAGSVRDGTGADIAYTNSTTQLSANWDASSDAQSGISGYQYAIGTSAGGTQTVNWTSLGNVTTVTKTGLSLTNGQTCYFSVKAVNGVGLTGTATNSNGQTVDSTAPSAPPTVRDGTGVDISTTSSNTQLSANWDASTDNESGISGYQYAIGTTAGGTQTVNWTSLGNVTTVTKTGLSLSNGQTYFFSVRAVNGAGLTGNATNSNGQTVVTVTGQLVGWWKFDGDATDSSSNNNPGTLVGNPTWVAGKIGQAINLNPSDGSDDSVTVTGIAAYEPAQTVSVAAWVKTTSTDTSGSEVVSMGNNYMLRVQTTGDVTFYAYTGSAWERATSYGVNVLDGAWHLLVGQKTSTGLEVYIDATRNGTYSTTTAISYTLGTNLCIGRHGNGQTIVDFNGSIDDVRLYNYALGLSDIQTLYNGGTDSTPPSAARRAGWNGSGHLYYEFHDPVVGQLGRQHRRRERHQRLSIRHRHYRRRHANGELDLLGQCNDGNQDRIGVDRWPNLLFQRPCREWRRTDRQRHKFQRPDGRKHCHHVFLGQFRELDGPRRGLEQRGRRERQSFAQHQHRPGPQRHEEPQAHRHRLHRHDRRLVDQKLQPHHLGRNLRAVLCVSPNWVYVCESECEKALAHLVWKQPRPDVGVLWLSQDGRNRRVGRDSVARDAIRERVALHRDAHGHAFRKHVDGILGGWRQK